MKTLIIVLLFCMALPLICQALTLTTGPDMTVARRSHFQFTDNNGTVWLVGGHTNGFVALSTAEYYIPISGVFTQLALSSNHDMCSVSQLDDARWIVCGGAFATMGNAPGVNNCDIINTMSHAIEPCASMNQQRMLFGSCLLSDGTVLAVGAWYNSNADKTGEIYSPTNNTWTPTGNMFFGRSATVVLPLNDGGALVIGGLSSFNHPDSLRTSVERFNRTTNQFTLVSEQLFPGEIGWTINSDMNQQLLLPSGNFLCLAERAIEGITSYTLFTVNPTTAEITKLPVILPNSSTDGLRNNVMYDYTYSMPFLLAYNIQSNANHLIAIAGNVAVSDTTRLDFDNLVGNSNMEWSQLQDGRILFTGGLSNAGGYETLFTTHFLTLPIVTPNNDQTSPSAPLTISNYPNPFNPTTTISYFVPKNENVQIGIYNMKGQLVKLMVNETMAIGNHKITWNGDNQDGNKVSSGVYFTKLETGGRILTHKMVMVK